MRNLEQERVRKAYEFVISVKGNEEREKKYSSLARKLPSMITQSGLITTLAFLKSKEKKEEEASGILLNHLLKYFSEKFNTKNDYDDVIRKLYNANITEYLYISQEMIAFSIWLKRIAEGELKHEE